MRHLKKLLADDRGATAVEYAMLLAMIVLVSVTTLGGFGAGVHNVYLAIRSGLP